MSGNGIDDVPNLPKFLVSVMMMYRTYRNVRYRYWPCTEVIEVSGTGMQVCTSPGGTGIHVVPNLPKSDTGIDVVPNLPKCPVPVIPAVFTGDMPRYVPYRTHPW